MSTNSPSRISTSKLLKSGGTAIIAAIVINVIARYLLGALFPLSSEFQPFSLGAIIIFTAIFTLVGVGVLAVVNRLTTSPLKVFNIIGVIALVLSIIPNLAASANPSVMPMGGSGENYLILIIFHFVAAASFMGILNLALRKAP